MGLVLRVGLVCCLLFEKLIVLLLCLFFACFATVCDSDLLCLRVSCLPVV